MSKLIAQTFISSGSYMDSLFDVEVGSSEDSNANKQLYVTVKNSTGSFVPFTAGSLTVLKQFEESQIIYPQIIPYQQFNAGDGRVLVHDFGVSDEKVKFKIVVDTNFVAGAATGGFYYETNSADQKRIIPPVYVEEAVVSSGGIIVESGNFTYTAPNTSPIVVPTTKKILSLKLFSTPTAGSDLVGSIGNVNASKQCYFLKSSNGSTLIVTDGSALSVFDQPGGGSGYIGTVALGAAKDFTVNLQKINSGVNFFCQWEAIMNM